MNPWGGERKGREAVVGWLAVRLTCSDPGHRFWGSSLLIQEGEDLWRAARGGRGKKRRERIDEGIEESGGMTR